mmetsp:Transcript_20168/g.67432  ORF Transcript_20168/g.67432 Transcript_20168/m.67432 type:complete len:90 (+) Transcript_20168:251-520(+)
MQSQCHTNSIFGDVMIRSCITRIDSHIENYSELVIFSKTLRNLLFTMLISMQAEKPLKPHTQPTGKHAREEREERLTWLPQASSSLKVI